MPPGEFAEKAIQARIKMIIPYLSKWPQAIAIMSLPPNVPSALATLLTMVDDICYYAGDRSVDVNMPQGICTTSIFWILSYSFSLTGTLGE